MSSPSSSSPIDRRGVLRLSIYDGFFAVQYATLAGGPLLAAFLLALGASPAQIGFVATLPLLGGLAQPLGAEVIRRRGGWRKPVCLGAVGLDLLLWPISLAATLLAEPQTALVIVLAVLVVQYAAESCAAIAWTSWISDLVPPRIRGRYFGRRNVLINAFGVVTAATAGFVLRHAAADVLVVFCGLIGLGMTCRGLSLYFLSRHPEPSPAQSLRGGFWRQITEPLRNAGFRRYVTYAAAWNLSVHAAAPFFTVYMIREAGISASTVMLFAAIGTAANLVGQRVWGPLCDRWGERDVLLVAGFVVTLQPLGWLFTTSTAAGTVLMGTLCATGGFVWGGHLLANGNLLMRLAPSLGKTSYFATQAALAGLFGAAGPLLGALFTTGLPAGIGGLRLFGVDLLGGLKLLFACSAAGRLLAWSLLFRVPVPSTRQPRGLVAVVRHAVRAVNPAQGLSPLLHIFLPSFRETSER